MEKSLKQRLRELADEDYRKFSASLLPTIDNVLGVRLPELRKLAKTIAKGEWRRYLEQAESDYFEEVMLQGMVIGYAQADIEEILQAVANFVPKIDNWSVCDSFCAGLKMTRTNKRRVWEFLQPYLTSEREYEVRFAVVMLLIYYVEDDCLEDILQRLDIIRHEGYYAKMAVAWAISICFVRAPERTMRYLGDNRLDTFTYNKALQKITESHRVDAETKKAIRRMKRKQTDCIE
ncbi:DNA alkylation repair protein [Brevibacillus composti]|uniref:DNA alkylation repair protein n=1 Tax=Brevibacillus composti TaxID=2796470 RepID=A0A7T5EJ12_9BACL|nr:DNA alkylation repair protein [Brevibacillus composti]QQE73495.1 DNA alkylation repair protein [Brevibacillus composti]QUO40577.1 DNA alkylation repair protein [Brevibacillus composti]